MARVCLQLFGGFKARFEGGRVLRLPTRKSEALLGYLALPAGQPHPRDKLASLLWGDLPEARARASLRQTLFRLRRAIGDAGGHCLRSDASAIGLDPAAVDVDVATFERGVATGDAERLAEVAAVYQGDLLAGLAVAEPPFEEWLLAERERLRELALEAHARLLAHHRAAGRPTSAVQAALRLAALDPLQEAVHRTLMRLYVQLGRRGAALRQYQHCVTVLRRELGVEPENETKQLYQSVLRACPGSRHEASPGPGDTRRAKAQVASAMGAPEAPLVGREREMDHLRAALADARAGRGGVMAIEGEAGIGKTRLLGELLAEASRSGMRVLQGRCYESEQILPFGSWIDALRSGGAVAEDGAVHRIEPGFRSELSRLFPELAGTALPSPAADARRLFESMTRLLEEVAGRAPLVLLLEDVHWGDDMSLRLLAFVARRIGALPVLVAVTIRTEELADVPALRRILDELRAENGLRLTLRPLGRADTMAIVHALLGPPRWRADLARLGREVWMLSQGNPFVVMEALRALPEEGSARARPLALPDTVRAVITRRLDHLGARSRELAGVGAVIGREFTFSLLLRACGLGEHEAAEAVEELVRRQVLQHVGDHFDFMHDRVREVAYTELLPPRRVLLHRAVAAALEAVHPDAAHTHCLPLGLHCLRGEVWDKAVTHLGRAGARAIERSAYREAAECLEQALAALARLPPEGPGLREQAIDLRLDLARPTLYQLGHVTRAVAFLLEAEAPARALGDEQRLGRVAAQLTFCFRSLGRKREAIDAGQRALRIASRLSDLEIEVPANTGLGQVLHDRGDYREAAALFRRNVAVLVGPLALQAFRGGAPRSIHARTCLASSLAELGEFDEAAGRAEEAMRAARAAEHPHALVVASAGLGHLLLRQGHGARAVEVLEPAVAMARTDDVALWFPRTASTL